MIVVRNGERIDLHALREGDVIEASADGVTVTLAVTEWPAVLHEYGAGKALYPEPTVEKLVRGIANRRSLWVWGGLGVASGTRRPRCQRGALPYVAAAIKVGDRNVGLLKCRRHERTQVFYTNALDDLIEGSGKALDGRLERKVSRYHEWRAHRAIVRELVSVGLMDVSEAQYFLDSVAPDQSVFDAYKCKRRNAVYRRVYKALRYARPITGPLAEEVLREAAEPCPCGCLPHYFEHVVSRFGLRSYQGHVTKSGRPAARVTADALQPTAP